MLQWKPHKVLFPPTDEEIALLEPEELLTIHAAYHEAIRNAEEDPYHYGYELPSWRESWDLWQDYRTLLLLGANRASKTEFGAKTVVKSAIENDNSLIFCFSQNAETSVLVQQAAIWKYLPPEYKRKSTSDISYISYKAQTGFSENSLILPNGSRIMFKTYTQWQQNQTILEGMELGSYDPKVHNVGAWCDEFLGGMDLLDRLYLRLATRDAKLLLTFTPKDGVTETVSNYVKEAKTIKSTDAPLLRELHGMAKTEVPTFQVNDAKNTCIVYFHTINNPWGGYDGVVEMCRSKNDYKYTLTAAYGVPTKSYTTRFPKFSEAINVVDPDKIPTTGVTRYQIIDPAGRKSWFSCWIAVDVAGTYWVYREYPSVDVGWWAEQGKNGKWVPGEGAKGQGFGLKDYIETFLEEEGAKTSKGLAWKTVDDWSGGEEIFERLIDPRLSAAKYQKADGDSSILEDLDELGFITKPAPGDNIEDGIQKLIDKMAYDSTREIDGTNRPHFYVSRECKNIILGLGEYTGDDGLKEPLKDVIDVLRYAAASDIDHIDSKYNLVTKHSGGY